MTLDGEEFAHSVYSANNASISSQYILRMITCGDPAWSQDDVCRHAVAHETCGPGQPDARQSPARAGTAAGKQPAPTVPKHLATPSLMLRAGNAAVYDEPEVDRVTPRGEPPLHAVADCTEGLCH